MTQWLYIRVYSVKMGFKACNCNTYKPIYEMDNPVGNKKKKKPTIGHWEEEGPKQQTQNQHQKNKIKIKQKQK